MTRTFRFGFLIGIGCLLLSVSLPGQSGGLLDQARALASVLREVDSLRTELSFSGVAPLYFYDGKRDTLSGDTLILRKPGRYQFVALPDSSLDIRVQYGDRSDSLLAVDTVVVLFGRERTDFYSPGRGDALKTIDQFPTAFYVLADYLEPGTRPGYEGDALDRLLVNPFLEEELVAWQSRKQSLRRHLRTYQLEQRQSDADSISPTDRDAPRIDLTGGDVPTAPERLQQASEELYARQPGLNPLLSQTAIIRGLATFVEKRAQEELSIVFLERMGRRLGNTHLGIMFPRTLELFTRFEINDYHSLLDNAYPYFRQDLQEVGRNFPRLLRNDTALTNLRYNPDVLNAAHFLEFTNLALTGQSVDSIMRRSVEVYRTEELEMDALLRKEFIGQLRDPAFAKNVLDPTRQQIAAQQALDGRLGELLGRLIRWSVPAQLAGEPDDPDIKRLANQVQRIRDHLRNEQYFLRRDQPREYTPFLQLYTAFAQADRTMLFDGARLADYPALIGSGKADSLFGARLLAYTQSIVQAGATAYVGDVFSGTIDQLDLLKDVHREALELQQQTYLARGMRALQVRTYLMEGLEKELAYWRTHGGDGIGRDTMALRFFQEVLTNEAVSGRLSDLVAVYFSGTIPLADQPGLGQLLKDEEIFQDSLLQLLKPHMNALAGQAAAKPEAVVFRQFGFMQEKWTSIVGLLSQIDQEKLKNALVEFDLSYLEEVERRFLAPAKTAFDQLSPPRAGDSPAATDAHNPFLQQAYRIQEIPPVTLPDTLLELEQALLDLRGEYQKTQREWEQVRQAWETVYSGGRETSFYAASRNARNLRSVSELGVVLLESFRIDQEDSIAVIRRDTTRLQLRSQDASAEIIQQYDTIRTVRSVTTVPRRWVRPEELDTILADPYLRRAFLGLLYQRISTIEGLPVDPETTGLLATQTVELTDAIRRARQEAERQPDTSATNRIGRYLPLARGTLRIFSTILNAPRENTTIGNALGLSTVASILENTLGTYEHLAQEQYGYALTSAMGLYQLFNESEPTKKGRLQAHSLQSSILTYGNFIADITAAKTSAQVQSTLETYAREPGNSRLKRTVDMNVSLNAYLGPALSYETPLGNVTDVSSSWVPSLSTPVGLAVNWRIARRRSRDGSIAYLPFTVFVPILDIGPVVSFNFSEGLLSSSPQLSFGDFLAPGIFAFYNVPRSPFTMGMGYQRTAEVRSVMTTGLERQNYRAGRFSLFLGIDVPVFNFYTKQ